MSHKSPFHTSQEIKNLIVLEFAGGALVSDLASKYNLTDVTIYNICKQAGLETNRFHKRLSKETKLEICKKYVEEKLTKAELSTLYNVNIKTILKAIKEFDIPKNKLNINKDFFDKLDTKESAYFSGLIASDGHLRHGDSIKNKKKDYSVTIKLKLTDINILEQFKTALKSEHKIGIHHSFDERTNKVYDSCTLQIHEKKLHDDLTKHGIGHTKSKDLKIPENIPNELLHYHFRALLDGDGSWFFSNTNKDSLNMSIVSSSFDFINQFKSILEKECNLHDNKIINEINTSGVYRLVYGGNLQCHKIADWIYQGDKYPCLERKYELVKKHFEWYDEKFDNKYQDYLTNEKLDKENGIFKSSEKRNFKPNLKENPKSLSNSDRLLGFV